MTDKVEETQEQTTDDSAKTIAALNLENAKRRKDNEALAKQLQEIKDREDADKVKNSQDVEELKRLNAEKDKALKEALEASTAVNDELTTYRERAAAERTELIEKVPEHLREDITDTTPLNLIKKLTITKDPPAGYRPPGDKTEGQDLTSTQRIAKGLAARS